MPHPSRADDDRLLRALTLSDAGKAHEQIARSPQPTLYRFDSDTVSEASA